MHHLLLVPGASELRQHPSVSGVYHISGLLPYILV